MCSDSLYKHLDGVLLWERRKRRLSQWCQFYSIKRGGEEVKESLNHNSHKSFLLGSAQKYKWDGRAWWGLKDCISIYGYIWMLMYYLFIWNGTPAVNLMTRTLVWYIIDIRKLKLDLDIFEDWCNPKHWQNSLLELRVGDITKIIYHNMSHFISL